MKIEYHNLYTHFIFCTYERQAIIPEENRDRIEKYITGIVNNNGCKLYAIYLNPDHGHSFISRSPLMSETELATIIADSSERFINQNQLTPGKFLWQRSAAAFSVSKADIDKICRYILNQPAHHKKVTFAEEYEKFIKYYQQTLRQHE
jgi:REP element-mobilizing transposase RayT